MHEPENTVGRIFHIGWANIMRIHWEPIAGAKACIDAGTA